jgi:hypothetical protein
MVDEAAQLELHLFNAGNHLVASDRVAEPCHGVFQGAIETMTGRRWLATMREWIVVDGGVSPARDLCNVTGWRAFAVRRGRVLREAMGKTR